MGLVGEVIVERTNAGDLSGPGGGVEAVFRAAAVGVEDPVSAEVGHVAVDIREGHGGHKIQIYVRDIDLVQRLMQDDTRSPVGAKGVHPFSGKIFCADCGSPMVRRVTRTGGHEYAYFICGGNKNDKNSCSSHSIKESVVYDTVLAVVQGHIAAAMDMADALTQIDNLAWENRELEKINAKIAFQEEIIDKNRRLKTGAYEDFKSDFISRDEYKIYTARFDQQIAEATETIMSLTGERNSVMGGLAEQQGWLAQFKEYENIQELTRRAVVSLIEYVRVNEDKEIEVRLMHGDRFASIVDFLSEQKEKEAAKRIIHLTREAV